LANVYLVASRQGIYCATREECRQLVPGAFFGIACVGQDVFAFRHDPETREAGLLSGRVIHYRWQAGVLCEQGVVAAGLDSNCHQLDFFDEAFFLVDTLNQQVLEYRPDWSLASKHRILPHTGADGPDYAHLNSIAGTADSVWLMLHNKKRGRPSEIVELDRNFHQRSRTQLACSGCHDIVPMPDGRLLTCLSPQGEIALVPGETHKIDKLWTRGLVAGADEIVVGSSLFGHRVGRSALPGFLTFLDPVDYRRTGRLYLPAAPTQIRRIEPKLAKS
jgi:hypothetical protein